MLADKRTSNMQSERTPSELSNDDLWRLSRCNRRPSWFAGAIFRIFDFEWALSASAGLLRVVSVWVRNGEGVEWSLGSPWTLRVSVCPSRITEASGFRPSQFVIPNFLVVFIVSGLPAIVHELAPPEVGSCGGLRCRLTWLGEFPWPWMPLGKYPANKGSFLFIQFAMDCWLQKASSSSGSFPRRSSGIKNECHRSKPHRVLHTLISSFIRRRKSGPPHRPSSGPVNNKFNIFFRTPLKWRPGASARNTDSFDATSLSFFFCLDSLACFFADTLPYPLTGIRFPYTNLRLIPPIWQPVLPASRIFLAEVSRPIADTPHGNALPLRASMPWSEGTHVSLKTSPEYARNLIWLVMETCFGVFLFFPGLS